MQVTVKQAVWIEPKHLQQFVDDPQGSSWALNLTSPTSKYLSDCGYIKLGEVDFSVPVSAETLRQDSIKVLEEQIAKTQAEAHAKVVELQGIKQNLLAITFEG
jgi:hypothetical protein